MTARKPLLRRRPFLSIQAQDFIEEVFCELPRNARDVFLSIQAQDFIEDGRLREFAVVVFVIPEHSSSGLH